MPENIGQRKLNFFHQNIQDKIWSSLSDIFRHEEVYLLISICFVLQLSGLNGNMTTSLLFIVFGSL